MSSALMLVVAVRVVVRKLEREYALVCVGAVRPLPNVCADSVCMRDGDVVRETGAVPVREIVFCARRGEIDVRAVIPLGGVVLSVRLMTFAPLFTVRSRVLVLVCSVVAVRETVFLIVFLLFMDSVGDGALRVVVVPVVLRRVAARAISDASLANAA